MITLNPGETKQINVALTPSPPPPPSPGEIAALAVVPSPALSWGTSESGYVIPTEGELEDAFDLDMTSFFGVKDDIQLYVQIDFNQLVSVATVRVGVTGRNTYPTSTFALLVSKDGVNWVELHTWSADIYGNEPSPWVAVNDTIRYIRISHTNVYGWTLYRYCGVKLA